MAPSSLTETLGSKQWSASTNGWSTGARHPLQAWQKMRQDQGGGTSYCFGTRNSAMQKYRVRL
jgi:hypothetical protein